MYDEVRQFTLPEINKGIAKLQRRIKDVNGLDPEGTPFDDATIDNVESAIVETIREVFGPRSPEFGAHEGLRIWHGPMIMGADRREYQQMFAAGIPQTITILEGLISRLIEKRDDLDADQPTTDPPIASPTGTRKVFVVHGHDDVAKQAVARFLTKLDLKPIILHEQPSKSRTVIEKIEANADVDFAVVIMTPDDVGYPADEPDKKTSRARQNVLLELGYFVGKLGRERVCVLHKGDVEILSDFAGVVFVAMDNERGWEILLAREIKAAGIDVDLNKWVCALTNISSTMEPHTGHCPK